MDSKWLKVKITVSVQLQRAINDTRRWIRVLSREMIGHLKKKKIICFINTNARLFCDVHSWLHVIRNDVEKVTSRTVLVDATELWAPERPDTETVSSPKQSISWTLDMEHTSLLYNYVFTTHLENTTLLYNYLFTTHLLFFSFQICTSDLTHNCLYCILCFFHFVHLYIVLLLSVSCPVAVLLLHCGASVTITNSSYV